MTWSVYCPGLLITFWNSTVEFLRIAFPVHFDFFDLFPTTFLERRPSTDLNLIDVWAFCKLNFWHVGRTLDLFSSISSSCKVGGWRGGGRDYDECEWLETIWWSKWINTPSQRSELNHQLWQEVLPFSFFNNIDTWQSLFRYRSRSGLWNRWL